MVPPKSGADKKRKKRKFKRRQPSTSELIQQLNNQLKNVSQRQSALSNEIDFDMNSIKRYGNYGKVNQSADMSLKFTLQKSDAKLR